MKIPDKLLNNPTVLKYEEESNDFVSSSTQKEKVVDTNFTCFRSDVLHMSNSYKQAVDDIISFVEKSLVKVEVWSETYQR